MESMDVDMVLSILTTTAHSMRVELCFLVVFSLLWFAGRLLSGRPAGGKDGFAGAPGKRGDRSHRRGSGAAGNHPGDASKPAGGARGGERFGGSAGRLDRTRLRDASWVVPQVTQLCRTQVQRALELYRSAMACGLDLQKVPADDLEELLSALVTSAIRVGQADEALRVIRALLERSIQISPALVASATKLCTSKQLFTECLAIYDLLGKGSELEVSDRSVWSCLLFCAVETKSFQRCDFFFDRLKACGAPTNKDYGNMIRVASTLSDWRLSLQLVQEMGDAGLEIDSVIYNTALATCVAGQRVDEALMLLEAMEEKGGIADAITYNTLAKGYVKLGRMDQCFELYERMKSKGIAPSQVTYGILLDGCINENQVDRAAEVFDAMKREGCPMNTVLYTTLIKGFVRAEDVDKAMQVFQQMRSEGGVAPDLITFSILVKANCDAGRLDEAMRLLDAMVELRLRPDEVVYNNLLGGCVKEGNADLAKRLYNDMVTRGIRPSNATFSILIRLYAQCKLLDEAVEMLKKEPAARKVDAEPRLYVQLAQSCLRERQGRRAVDVYKLLLESSGPTTAMNSSLLATCVKLNMLDTGVELLGLAAEAGGRVDGRDALQVHDAAIRKKRTQIAQACAAAMARLGLPLPSATAHAAGAR